MGRGGPRQGAGRPKGTSKLSFMQKMALGGKCESLHFKAKQEHLQIEVDKQTAHARPVWEYVQAIPTEQRSEWLDSDAFDDYRADIREALQKDQGIFKELPDESKGPDHSYLYSDSEPNRNISIPNKRPKGIRESIIKTVAEESGLSNSQVDHAWKHYRSVVEQLDEEAP